jgi:hypothetical protein
VSYDYARFCQGIAALDGEGCWLAAFLAQKQAELPHDYSPGLSKCDGQLDGHHILKKGRLKQEAPFPCRRCAGRGTVVRNGPSEYEYDSHYPCSSCTTDRTALRGTGEAPLSVVLEDARNGILVCRRHHDLLECALVVLRRQELPGRFEEFVADYGLDGWASRYYMRDAA